MRKLKAKLHATEGLGTLEIVLIIAILLTVALIFRESLLSFANSLLSKVFNHSIIDQLN